MTDEEVDKVLQNASGTAPGVVEPALLKRIADSINSSLQPVRPLPPAWVITGGLALICAAVAVTAAARAGFNGIENLRLWERVPIFATLAILLWMAGKQFVGQLIPGSRQRLPVGAFMMVAGATLLGVFALLFHDYRTEHFISAGITCLMTGLLVAVPAGLLSWLLLRRGYAVDPAAAGLVGGALAGLCGVSTLELHCANFQALHVLVWHTAVMPAGAAVGALVAWALRGDSIQR